VQVHLADGAAGVAGRALEEAEGRGLEREARDRQAPDERHGRADRVHAQRSRAGGGVGVAQQVGGEALVGFEHGDHLPDARLVAAGQLAHAAHRGAEHGQASEVLDGAKQARVRLDVIGGVGRHVSSIAGSARGPRT
jgi:hypothetical protein